MTTKFFTNRDKNTLFNKFEGIFSNNPALAYFDILVGYFRSSGYFKIRPLLNDIDKIRILVGINVDKIAQKMHQHGLVFMGNENDTIAYWQKKFIKDIQDARYEKDIEDGMIQFVDDMKTNKIALKAHPSKNIHAKLYIFRPQKFNQHHFSGSVITGSSNLTDAGLGTKKIPNYEYNVQLNDYDDIKFATDEFEALWEEGIDILPNMVEKPISKTHLKPITPYELYLKFLIEYFGNEIEFDPSAIENLPEGFSRLSYQMDAVNQGFTMLKKHDGFFLSDVVGLGKTIIAILIAKQFYYTNNYPKHRSKILLITPPSIQDSWKETVTQFDIDDAFTTYTNGSLHNIEDTQKYDLVIVDEAHRFRNSDSKSYELLQNICKASTRDGNRKKIILISATPLNNNPKDLRNQISLFQDGNNSTLNVHLDKFFGNIIKKYKTITNKNNTDYPDPQDRNNAIKRLYKTIREKVIMDIMIRRTRTDLSKSKRYKADLEKQGITFPEIKTPIKLLYQLSPELEKLYDKTLKIIHPPKGQPANQSLQYARYQALKYLKPEYQKPYRVPEHIVNQLKGLMKTLLLKRMDSSFVAFKTTLNNFIRSSEAMLKMIDDNKIIIAPKLDIVKYVMDDKTEKLEELIEKMDKVNTDDKNIHIHTRDDFEDGFRDAVQNDHTIFRRLQKEWQTVNEDPKLDEFKRKLPEMIDKNKNAEQKLVVFTESIDTMNHIYKSLDKNNTAKILCVNAKNYTKRKTTITENFDANASIKKKDYNILIATEVLAEGINLHRANTIINYDTPWNSTRLIQRIGRINRIGTQAKHIYIYNFFPSSHVDSDIDLRKRAILKLQAFHTALGEDSQIYSTEEEPNNFGIFDETIIEERDEYLPYLDEIRQIKENKPELYQRLKKRSNKSRNAVINIPHAPSTMVFLRNEDKKSGRFYDVKKSKVNDCSFLKMAKRLKCKPDTQALPKLPEHHYDDVNRALESFKKEAQEQMHQKPKLTPQHHRAINYLKSFQNRYSDDPNIKSLENAIKHIINGTLRHLSTAINKIKKQNKPLDQQYQEVIKIIKDRHVTEQPPTPKSNTNTPQIIISQSYESNE